MLKEKEQLGDFSLFRGVTPELFDELLSISSFKTIPKSAIFAYENDILNNLNFLYSGLLKVYKVDRFEHETFLYNIMPGIVISELTDLTHKSIRCFSNIEAIEESVILSIDKNALMKLCDEHTFLYKRLLEAFAHKSMLMQCLISRELVYDGTAKVAYTIIYERDLFERMKKQEIAAMLNMQPETLSRILKKFVRKGLIELNTHGVVIVDKDALNEVLI